MIRTFSILGAVIFGMAPHITRAESAQPPDLMSFASGTLPVSATSDSGTLKVGTEHAVLSIDGNPSGFVAHRKPAEQGDAIEFLFALPAPTRFDGLLDICVARITSDSCGHVLSFVIPSRRQNDVTM